MPFESPITSTLLSVSLSLEDEIPELLSTEVFVTSVANISINSTVETLYFQTEKVDLTLFVVLIYAVMLPLSLFVILGNILVIIAVYNSFHLRQRGFYYVVGSMAVTDMLVGVSMLPLYYSAIFVETVKESVYGCMTMITIAMIPCTISILHVLVIAGDRYIAVFYSLHYMQWVTQRRIFTLIAIIWVFALSLHSLPFIGWRKTHPDMYSMAYCFTDQFWTPSVACFHFSVTVIAPLCIMIGIYAQIIRAARLQARRVDAQQDFALNRSEAIGTAPLSTISVDNDSSSRAQDSQVPVIRRRGPTMAELKATKTSAIVLGTFLVCWLPAYCVHLSFTFINSNRTEPLHNPTIGLLHASSNLLPFFSSAANPVIYAFRYKDFRKSFKQSLQFSCRREN